MIKEYNSYLWKEDKDGRILNDPEGGFDHALDAVRYAMSSFQPSIPDKFMEARILQNRETKRSFE